MVTSARVYCPVRRSTDDSREWFDVACASRAATVASDNADKLNARIPDWAKANPVVRIATCTLTEEE